MQISLGRSTRLEGPDPRIICGGVRDTMHRELEQRLRVARCDPLAVASMLRLPDFAMYEPNGGDFRRRSFASPSRAILQTAPM